MNKPMLTVAALGALLCASGCASMNAYPVYEVDEFRRIQANPQGHLARVVAFRGRVVDTQFDPKKGNTVQLILDEDRMPELLIFTLKTDTPVTALNDDRIKVLGYPMERVTGLNAFGGVTTGLLIDGIGYIGQRGGGAKMSERDMFDRWADGSIWR